MMNRIDEVAFTIGEYLAAYIAISSLVTGRLVFVPIVFALMSVYYAYHAAKWGEQREARNPIIGCIN